MKTKITTVIFTILTVLATGQNTYKGYPLLKSDVTKADYRIGNDWVKGSWNISPQIEYDSLYIPCYAEAENFTFFTNRDSIQFTIFPEQIHKFYVSLNDTAYAMTVVKGIRPHYQGISFDTSSKDEKLMFSYEQNINNAYLNRLRSLYPIDSLVKGAKTDTEKALKILHWVHNQWKHNGMNEPLKRDAISILEEVKAGKNFRCVEYGIVTTACLNSIGLRARVLGLRTSDVETRRGGAGHVLLEVYLNDLQKWALLDGQWDAMPVLNNVPLNAVEFQKAIVENYNDLEIRTSSGTSKRYYINWIYPYLFYFEVPFDNREGTKPNLMMVEGKTKLMLVPSGEKNPAVFQRISIIDNCLYSNSINDFYASPE